MATASKSPRGKSNSSAKAKLPPKKVVAKKTSAKVEKEEVSEKISGDYNLVIVESPSKAKTIKKYLGKGYQVAASNGHVKDLPKSKLGVDVKHGFTMDLVPITGKQVVLDKLAKLAKDAKAIYLAPDPDREGEAIAYHLMEELGKKKKYYRVLFNAITKNSVVKAIENPSELDENKYDSQKTRRILDRLVGYKISPILWEKVQRGLSAGRVQSVALRIIVEKEDEIKAFVSEQWFSITAKLKDGNTVFEAHYYGEEPNKKSEILEEKVANKILADIKNKDFKVSEIKKRERKQNPSPPFTTSKLQQEAVNKLGFTTKKTMMIAQRLYEGVDVKGEGMQGLITYMRTDSFRTEPEALNNLRKYLKGRYGDKYLSEEPIYYKKKGSSTAKVQDAHESIRPTNLDFEPSKIKDSLSDDEFKLYSLIWNKFVSSQMSPAVIDQTTVSFDVNNHFFRANGSIIKFAGFRTVYIESAMERAKKRGGDEENEEESANENSSNNLLPDLKEGQLVKPIEIPLSEEHWTSPPPRYNEASLVKELEEKGIGRPSTYAAIISNITDKGYVEKIENRLLPTELGIAVCRMLVLSFPNEMDVQFTAKLEEQLDQIADGDVKWTKVLKDFWGPFEKTLDKAKEEMKDLKKQEIPTGIHCGKCKDGMMNIRWGRNGSFLACSNYPDCNHTEDFTKSLDGKITIVEKKYHSDPCPTCHKRLEVKTGKYGKFVRCEDYPKCDTTLPYTLPVSCPECKTGKFVEKKGRFKLFYGCSSYPNCNNAIWDLPVNHVCPECSYPIMGQRYSKRDGKFLQCPKCKHKVNQGGEEE
jgi:DNA topoisomerase-1